MIDEAKLSDLDMIVKLWKHAYPNVNDKVLEYKAQRIFDQGSCLTYFQDNKMVSTIQMKNLYLNFKDKVLCCSYILQSATLPDYRRRGYMHQLMQSLIDEVNNNCLFTFVTAFNPKLYEKYGFEVVYERKKFHIRYDNLKDVQVRRISKNAHAMELLNVYREFIRRFDGYFKRDLHYYEDLLEELKLGEKKIVVYRDRLNVVCGYAIYSVKKNVVEVEEIIYLDSNGLKKMLKAMIGIHKMVVVEVSNKERLERLFPLAIIKRQSYMMARLNNVGLFQKLFNCEVKNAKEAYAMLDKPQWMHEKDY